MNSLTKHLSLKTALNLPLAQISCAALRAYLSLNLGTTGLRRQEVTICSYWRLFQGWLSLQVDQSKTSSRRAALTGALRTTGLRLFPPQLIVISHNHLS